MYNYTSTVTVVKKMMIYCLKDQLATEFTIQYKGTLKSPILVALTTTTMEENGDGIISRLQFGTILKIQYSS